jgi:sec-independent protein translocase protein TatA
MFEGLLSPWHLLVLLIICVLFFGNRIPEIARSLGKGIVEFKKGMHGLEDENEDWQNQQSLPKPPEKPQPPARESLPSPKFEEGAG